MYDGGTGGIATNRRAVCLSPTPLAGLKAQAPSSVDHLSFHSGQSYLNCGLTLLLLPINRQGGHGLQDGGAS